LHLHVRTLGARGQRRLVVPPPLAPTPVAAPAGARPSLDLGDLAAQIRRCARCGLHRSRTHAVVGEGAVPARLMFIGEAPGLEEDRTGRPFVGAAGRLLDAMLAAMGLQRCQVYIANIAKCRPPANRPPLPNEMDACRPYLDAQIAAVAPQVIVTLGRTALLGLFPRSPGIMKARGRWLEHQGIAVMPTFHPAFLLRNQQEKRVVWQDLKAVMERLDLPLPPSGRRGAADSG
jgi:DNA polymerase